MFLNSTNSWVTYEYYKLKTHELLIYSTYNQLKLNSTNS
jgi:hypothetical protein